MQADISGVGSRRDQLIGSLKALVVAGTCLAVVWLVYRLGAHGDYQTRGPVLGDNAGPAIDALIHGHLAGMVSVQPLMGLTSVLWRVPFVGVADLFGGSDRLVYGLGTFACLLPAAGLVAWLARRATSLAQLAGVAVAAAAIVAGPATHQAPQVGHPEEILATVLAAAAVISAAADRGGWAALALGLAIGTKQWTLLAAPCVLLALPSGRSAVAAKAAAVALPAAGILPLLDPRAFANADASVGSLRFINPFSLWWPMGLPDPGEPRTSAHLLALGLTRSEAAAVLLLVVLGLIGAYGRRVRAGRDAGVDGLALLALIGLIRCVTDPDPLTYNFVALVIPLAAWEAGTLKRLPVLTVLTCVVLALLPTGQVAIAAGHGLFLAAPILSLVWIALALALGCHLTRRALRPGTAETARIPSPSAAAATQF